MIDLNDVVVFVKVVQAGSFIAAARELGIPKTTVSRKVAQLESQLHAQLLHRTTRKLSLTEAGAQYVERCLPIIRAIEDAELAAVDTRSVPQGVLRISMPIVFSATVWRTWLTDFLGQYEHVALEVVTDNRMRDLVAESIDLALRVGPLEDSSLVARKLSEVAYVMCASPEYLRRHRGVRRPADLERHACITTLPQRGKWTLVQNAQVREVTVGLQTGIGGTGMGGTGMGGTMRGSMGQGQLITNDLLLVREAVLAGLDIALLPRFLVQEELADHRLLVVLPRWQPPTRELFAVYPSKRLMPAKVRAFLDFIADQLREHPDSFR